LTLWPVVGGAVTHFFGWRWAGMASGLASTTRFIAILVGVAIFGAVLSNITYATFMKAGDAAHLNREMVTRSAFALLQEISMGCFVQCPRQHARVSAIGLTAYGLRRAAFSSR
jgi:MFS family permease